MRLVNEEIIQKNLNLNLDWNNYWSDITYLLDESCSLEIGKLKRKKY
jgi:hypothetical protein